MKLALCALVAMVAAVGTSIAAGSSPPITARVLAAGSAKQAITLRIPSASETVFETIKVAPGGSFGWHSHGAPAAVVVESGTLTLFDPSFPGCAPRRMGPGQAFFEQKNHVHLARNDGSKPVTVMVAMLGLTAKAKPTVPRSQPAGCSAQ